MRIPSTVAALVPAPLDLSAQMPGQPLITPDVQTDRSWMVWRRNLAAFVPLLFAES